MAVLGYLYFQEMKVHIAIHMYTYTDNTDHNIIRMITWVNIYTAAFQHYLHPS